MLQRIVGLVVTVMGVLFALVIGVWAFLSVAVVAAGAAIVYAFRSRGGGRARKRHRRGVIEGEFTVMNGKEQDPGEENGGEHRDVSRRFPPP